MRALSHKKLSLNLKKLNYLENLYAFILSYSNLTAKSKKIAGGSGMGKFELNNSNLNSVSLIKKKEKKIQPE